MLFPPKSVSESLQRILDELRSGRLSAMEAGERLLAVDPEFPTAYTMLGSAKADAGDLEEAEALLWKGLDLQPCQATVYMLLADLRRRLHPGDVLADRLIELAVWKLSFANRIPPALAKHFRESLGKEARDFDFSDPYTYRMLAEGSEALAKDRTDTAEVVDRLLPYRLLNDLQRQAASEVERRLIEEFIAHADRCAPLLHSALREMARSEAVRDEVTACTIAALLGETGGPEAFPDLLESSVSGEPGMFLHGGWAVWRMGQRFPAAAFAALRAAIPGAPPVMRCAIAEQLDLLPREADITPALAELLEGFEKFAAKGDAPHLLACVNATLRKLGREDLAEAAVARYANTLSAQGRKSFESMLEEGTEFLTQLAAESIDEFDIGEVCYDRVFMDEFEEDEEEDEGPPAVKPGRNEPCWCGSGKKYKKCHLAEDEEYERRRMQEEEEEEEEEEDEEEEESEPTGDPDEQRLFAEILAASVHKSSELKRAARLYFDDPEEVDADTAEQHGFFEWYLRDYRAPSTGRTPVEEFLRRKGPHLPARDRQILEAWRDARFGLYEIERIDEGTGVELRDLCAVDRFFVNDVSSSRKRAKWDCMLARVEELDGKRLFSGNGLLVPRPLVEPLLETIESERKIAGRSAAEFVRANSHRLHNIVAGLQRDQFANLQVVNAEGDPIEFCAAKYDVRDEAAAVEALRGSAELEPDDPADEAGVRGFAWLEAKESDSRRSYGRIEIRNGRLRLECNSRQRLEKGRRLVEERAGAFLRHTGDSLQSLDSIKQQVLSRKPSPKKSSLPPEVEREIVLKYKQEHYATWPDFPLPVLGGRTPRDAVRTAEGRRAVENLLRTMENGEDRERKHGRPAFDFAPLRKTLGLG